MTRSALRAVRGLKAVGEEDEIALIHGFSPLGKAQMTFAGLDHQTMGDYSANEALQLSRDLTTSLEEDASDYRPRSLRLQEGNALTVIV